METAALVFRWRDELERPWVYNDWWGETEAGYIYDQMTFTYRPHKDDFYDECGFLVEDIGLFLDPAEILVFKTMKKDRVFLRKNPIPTPLEPDLNEIHLIYGESE